MLNGVNELLLMVGLSSTTIGSVKDMVRKAATQIYGPACEYTEMYKYKNVHFTGFS